MGMFTGGGGGTSGSGTGDVVGPGSATDNAITRFDSTTGKLVQNSGATIDDTGIVTATRFVASSGGGEGGALSLPEGTTPASGTGAGITFCYADSTLHGIKCSYNNGTYVNLADQTGIQNQSYIYAADAGSNDTYVITLSPAPAAYAAGQRFTFKANTANTGAATLNVNSLGAKTIKKAAGGITTDLADNDIRAGQYVDVVYDGTNFEMQSLLGNAPSAGYTMSVGTEADSSPTDGVTYYMGFPRNPAGGLNTVYNDTRIRIPKACTITDAFLRNWVSSGSAGSNENVTVTIYKNGTTDSASTTWQWTSGAGAGSELNWNPNISVVAGDYVAVKFVSPTWATNPTNLSFWGELYCE